MNGVWSVMYNSKAQDKIIFAANYNIHILLIYHKLCIIKHMTPPIITIVPFGAILFSVLIVLFNYFCFHLTDILFCILLRTSGEQCKKVIMILILFAVFWEVSKNVNHCTYCLQPLTTSVLLFISTGTICPSTLAYLPVCLLESHKNANGAIAWSNLAWKVNLILMCHSFSLWQ